MVTNTQCHYCLNLSFPASQMELHRINTLGTQEKHCIKVFRKIINKNYLFEIFFVAAAHSPMSLLVNATSSHLRTTLQKRWNLSRPIFRLASLALRLLASSPRRVLTLSPSPLTRPTTPLTLHSSIGQSSCQLPLPLTFTSLS